MRRQDKEETEQFQSDLKEASDYLKPILDNMVADLREKQAEQQAQFETQFDAKVDEILSQINDKQVEDLDNLDQFIQDTNAKIDAFTSMTYEDMEAQLTPYVLQAYYEEPVYEPSPAEQAAQQIRDAFASWGWDSDVAGSWLEETGASWEELMRRQDQEQTEQFQSDLQEASDYLKPILDNMVADLREKQAEQQAQFEQQAEEAVSELKTKAAEQAK